MRVQRTQLQRPEVSVNVLIREVRVGIVILRPYEGIDGESPSDAPRFRNVRQCILHPRLLIRIESVERGVQRVHKRYDGPQRIVFSLPGPIVRASRALLRSPIIANGQRAVKRKRLLKTRVAHPVDQIDVSLTISRDVWRSN